MSLNRLLYTQEIGDTTNAFESGSSPPHSEYPSPSKFATVSRPTTPTASTPSKLEDDASDYTLGSIEEKTPSKRSAKKRKAEADLEDTTPLFHITSKKISLPLDDVDQLLVELKKTDMSHQQIAHVLEQRFGIKFATKTISSRHIRIQQILKAEAEANELKGEVPEFDEDTDDNLCKAYDYAIKRYNRIVETLTNRIWYEVAQKLNELTGITGGAMYTRDACHDRYMELQGESLANEVAAAMESSADPEPRPQTLSPAENPASVASPSPSPFVH